MYNKTFKLKKIRSIKIHQRRVKNIKLLHGLIGSIPYALATAYLFFRHPDGRCQAHDKTFSKKNISSEK